MFLLFYQDCEQTSILKYLLPDFEDVFEYLRVLVGAEPDVVLIAVQYDFVRVGRDGDGAYVCDWYVFFDMLVINEVELFTGDSEPVIDLLVVGSEEYNRNHIE